MNHCYVIAWLDENGTTIVPKGYRTRKEALQRIALALNDYEGSPQEKMDAYNDDHSEDTEGGVTIHKITLPQVTE